MSERGSFVTEFIYCDACFAAAQKILNHDDKYLTGRPVQHPRDEPDGVFPIVAGKIGELWATGEYCYFENELVPQLAKAICHPMRVAVIADAEGGKVYRVLPGDTFADIVATHQDDGN